MNVKKTIGLILITGTILTPFVIHFGICLRNIIEELKCGEEPDEDDAAYVYVYIAMALILTGIVLVFG